MDLMMSPGFRVGTQFLLLHIKGTVTVFEVGRKKMSQELVFLPLRLSRRDGCHLDIFPKDKDSSTSFSVFSVLLSTYWSWDLRPLMLLKTAWATVRRHQWQVQQAACWPQCLPCSLLWPWWEHEGPGETVPIFCHICVELNNHQISRGSVTGVVNKGVCNLSLVILQNFGQEAETWWSRNC